MAESQRLSYNGHALPSPSSVGSLYVTMQRDLFARLVRQCVYNLDALRGRQDVTSVQMACTSAYISLLKNYKSLCDDVNGSRFAEDVQGFSLPHDLYFVWKHIQAQEWDAIQRSYPECISSPPQRIT